MKDDLLDRIKKIEKELRTKQSDYRLWIQRGELLIARGLKNSGKESMLRGLIEFQRKLEKENNIDLGRF